MRQFQARDVPYEVFTAFSGSNQSVYMDILLQMEEMEKSSFDRSVDLAELRESASAILQDEGDRAGRAFSAHLYKLQGYRLVRRQNIYDDQEGGYVEKVFLTGTGRKLLDFASELTRSDLDETKDYNIQNALVNMRFLKPGADTKDMNLYDCLQSAYRALETLSAHLNSFAGEFSEFIERSTKNMDSAKKANKWLHTMYVSPFVQEYYAMNEESLGYSAKMNEMARIAEKTAENADMMECLTGEYKKKQAGFSTEFGEVRTDVQIRAEILFKLRRIINIAGREYHDHAHAIGTLVMQVIRRTFFLLSSYGTMNETATLSVRLLQMIRMCEETGGDVPDILSLYDMRCADTDSLKAPPTMSKHETPEISDGFVPIGAQKPPVLMKDEAREKMRNMSESTGSFAIRDLPCGNDDEYGMILNILYVAMADDWKKWRIEGFRGIFAPVLKKNGYTLPDLILHRKEGEVCREITGKEAGLSGRTTRSFSAP